MATKTASKKTAASRKKTTAAKSSSKKLVYSLDEAKNLDLKGQTVRFAALYVVTLIACLVMACICVRLYFVATDIETKYESLETCVREGVGCDVKNNKASGNNTEAIVEEPQVVEAE